MNRSTTLTFSALMAISMLATSCGQKETAPDNTIDLTPAFESKDIVNFFDILDTAYVIKLETLDECLVGRGWTNYSFLDKYICVYDPESSVFFFDRNGNFVRSIRKGNGPGEIVGGGFCFEDKNRNRLIIKDWSNRLKFYDYDLNYIGCKDFPYPSGVAVVGDRYLMPFSMMLEETFPELGIFFDCKLIATDTNFNVLDGKVHYALPKVDPNACLVDMGYSFGQGNGYAYYQQVQWDTLYFYDTAFHALAIEYPDKANINMIELTCDKMYEFEQTNRKNYIEGLMKLDDYILFMFQPSNIVLYCNSTKKSAKMKFAPYGYSCFHFDNCLVESFSYEDLERYKDSDESKMPEYKRVLSKSDYAKLANIGEEDNPALVIYQLKKTLE